MTAQQLSIVKRLANQATKAARLVERNRFLIETYLSLDEAQRGKVRSHDSAKSLLARLGV